MEYKVLYRKYRPETFDNIVDQDVIIKTLKNAITNNKVSHAYLFSGPRGTGKTSTAKVFAKALNCENYKDGPCNECNSCKNFSSNPDIIEIDAASNNGVDDVRELINNVKLSPSISKYKVYIIDEVHMLTTNAFNALLLTLEEPPSNVVFILATTNVESVPITILSRCQRFDFSQISLSAINERIKFICNKENIKIDDEAINEIGLLSEGGLRDALSILDQLSSQNDKIDLSVVLNSYKIVNSKVINEIIDYINNDDTDSLLKIIDDIKEKNYDFKNFIKKIINALFNYLNNNYNKINNISKYENLIFSLNKLLSEVNIYINPYILLKTLIISILNNENSKEETNVTKTSDSNNVLKTETSNDNDSKDLKELRINNTFVNPKKEYLKRIKEEWNKFLNDIHDKKLLSLLVDSEIVVCSDTNAIISTEIEATSHLINASIKSIEKEYASIFKNKIRFIAISNDEWKNINKEYIKNIKEGINYTYIEEADGQDELNKIASDLFDNRKIEKE